MTILFIEDDEIERMKFQRILANYPKHGVVEARNGKDAWEFLQREGGLPDLILMDINMPLLNGIEFLEMLKASDRLRHIPAVTLTTSKNPRDIHRCFEIGIAGYLVKPLRFEDHSALLEKVLAYWESNLLLFKTNSREQSWSGGKVPPNLKE